MADPRITPPLPGDTVGPYRLVEVIGVGGMATVYQATGPRSGPVAVKILHPGKAETDEERRFRREFLTLKELHHPGVVRVYEYGRHGAYPWIAMERVVGTDLGTLLDQWRHHPPADRFTQTERILRGLCEALAYVHERGLIHRDLKPGNILITADGKPKLTDFGVVKTQGGVFSTQLTMAGRLVGTIAFMAPEQIMAEEVDARADLYSLGAVLYLLLTGERPIIADNIAGYLSRHLTQDPRPPSEIDPRVPPRLERITMRLLRKDAAQRFPSARQVLVALDADERSQRPTVHGRHEELAGLLARLETLRTGGGGVVIIEGEPGLGKSTLLQELAEAARGAGFELAHAKASAPDPIGQLAAQAGAAAGSPLLRLAQRARARPWTLLLDDWDQLSPADEAALTRLLRESLGVAGDPLLFITTLRRAEGPAAAFAAGATTGTSPERHALRPLDRKAIIAVVRDQGLTGAAGLVLGGRLHEELGGNPGAAIAQLQALIEAGWLSTAPGALLAQRSMDALRGDPLPVPLARKAQEEARLAAFDPDARRVFDALVLLGVEVTADLLADTAGLDVGTVEAALAQLSAQGLVAQRVDGVQELSALARPAAQDLYARFIPAETATALHRAAAAALRRRSRRRAGAFADLIAAHLLGGGLPAEALPLLLDAARRRLRADKVDEANRLLEKAVTAAPALATLPDDEARRHRAQLHALRGEALERSGALAPALDAWERALDEASTARDADATARARAGIGLVRASMGEGQASIAALEAASRTLPPGDPLWPRVTEALADARLASGQLAAAETLYRTLEGLGRDTGSAHILANGILGRALVARCTGDVPGARTLLESVEDRLREGGASAPLGRVLAMVADLALADGRLGEAHDRAAEAERIFRHQELSVPLIHTLALQAEIFSRRGPASAARQLAREALALVRVHSEALTGPYLLAHLRVARALCLAGLPDEAQPLLRDLPPPARAALDDPAAQLLGAQARAARLVDPARAAQAALELLARPPAALPVPAARAALDAAIVLHQLDHPRAAAAAREALSRSTLPGMRLLRRDALELALQAEARPAWQTEVRAIEAELGAELHPMNSDPG